MPYTYGEPPGQRETWDNLWKALASFSSLRTLHVTIVNESDSTDPGPHDDDITAWMRDTAWIEPVRQVVAPTVFQLTIPSDADVLDVDTSPSSCRLSGRLTGLTDQYGYQTLACLAKEQVTLSHQCC